MIALIDAFIRMLKALCRIMNGCANPKEEAERAFRRGVDALDKYYKEK
jgi:hypothetical protein